MKTTGNWSHNSWLKVALPLLGISLVILLAWGFSPSLNRWLFQGDADIQHNRGGAYANSEEMSQDHKRTRRLLLKAANQGDAAAQFLHGLMYYQGKEVPKDKKEAVRWWKKAAEQGFARAQFHLGMVYLSGGEGVAQDRAEGKRWLKKAAAQGHNTAQSFLQIEKWKDAEARRR